MNIKRLLVELLKISKESIDEAFPKLSEKERMALVPVVFANSFNFMAHRGGIDKAVNEAKKMLKDMGFPGG